MCQLYVSKTISTMLNRFQVVCLTTQPSQAYLWDYFIITDQHVLKAYNRFSSLGLEDNYSSRKKFKIDTNEFLTCFYLDDRIQTYTGNAQ
mgnify:CR=1 FL=1